MSKDAGICDHPVGNVGVTEKMELVQVALSALVTERVYGSPWPAVPDSLVGVSDTVGLAWVQGKGTGGDPIAVFMSVWICAALSATL